MPTVVGIRFKKACKIYYFDPAETGVAKGDFAIVETARGVEYGEVVIGPREVEDKQIVSPLKPVMRKATADDDMKLAENKIREKEAFNICLRKIKNHGLPMRLIDVEFTFDVNKIIFYFTADGRIDFRELVKDLAAVFRTRIELRQIGVRDESKMLGGLGLCGQPFCCSRFLKNFQPVSIKMAKEQGLSLNPAKISGSCGRLMCCLAYEQKSYEYLNSITPQVGSIVRTPDGEGTVIETNVVAGTLKVRSNVEILAPRIYKREECAYIRGGKRAPQPADPED